MTRTRPSGVRWISAPPGDGYGYAALGYVGALVDMGVPVTWTLRLWNGREQPVGNYDGPLADLVGRPVEHDTVVLHAPPGEHGTWLEQAGRRRAVLYTTWETDRLPEGWVSAMDDFDAVVVPSTFNRDSYLEAGCTTEVHVVPHCARSPEPVLPAHFERIGDRFVFYTIGTWGTRKAMGETVTAFLDAFGRSDDVALVVKTTPHNLQAAARRRKHRSEHGLDGRETASWQAVAALVAGRRDVPELYLIAEELSAHDLDALHARGDCFVSLTRAEGWGLCIADALVFGNPAVVTGWGGQLDYLGEDYPLLVDYDLVATTDDVDDLWFRPSEGRRWARARHDHAVDVLRWVADHRDEAAEIGRNVGHRVAIDYSPVRTGARLLEALSAP